MELFLLMDMAWSLTQPIYVAIFFSLDACEAGAAFYAHWSDGLGWPVCTISDLTTI